MTATRSSILITTLLLLTATPAFAQMNYYNADAKKPAAENPTADDANGGMPGTSGDDAGAAPDDSADNGDSSDNDDESNKIMPAQSAVVTSVDACLKQLDPDEAAEVRRNYQRPYQECQSRLAEKLSKKKTAKAGAAQKGPEAESPRNFVRVQPLKADPTPPPGLDSTSAGASNTPADAPMPTGHWSTGDNPKKSTYKLNN